MSSSAPSGSTPHRQRGRLRVYLGAAPGVGKTYAMLAEARRLATAGVDVVVGLAETHGRADTEALLAGLDQIPPCRISHRGLTFSELDVDAVLARHPAAVLVDELPHTCAPGSRHEKRWEDVAELLDRGIDVITSLNVQHLDSLHDAVEALTGISQRETVPDAVVAAADEIEFLDITPEQLRARITAILPGAVLQALTGFFTPERLAALRNLAAGWLQQRDRVDAAARVAAGQAAAPAVPGERVVAALTGAPEGEHVLRRAAQIAASLGAELIGVHVREPSGLVEAEPAWLAGQRRLLGELGGRYTELAGIDVATAVLDFAHAEGAAQLVLGATRRSRRQELLHGSVINKAIRAAGAIEVHVVPARRPPEPKRFARLTIPSFRHVPLPGPRRLTAWVAAVLVPTAITIGLTPLRSSLGLTGALLANLLVVVGVALLGGILPALLATGVTVVASDFFFTEPLHTLRIANLVDVVALITFGIVAVAVGGLVDLLIRQGVQVAHATAEAGNLARLTVDALATPGDLTDVLDSVRRAFHLDAIAILSATGAGWTVEATVGQPCLRHPDQAAHQVQIDSKRILAIANTAPTTHDTEPLHAFLTELRLARERALLQVLDDKAKHHTT